MNSVPHDRTGQGAAELPGGEVGPVPSGVLRRQTPVLEEAEHRAVESVRARLCHGVEEPAGEVSETHVERRGEHLEFADRLQRDRVRYYFGERAARTRATRRSSEVQVRVHAAIDLEAVIALILSSDRDAPERPQRGEGVERRRDAQVSSQV